MASDPRVKTTITSLIKSNYLFYPYNKRGQDIYRPVSCILMYKQTGLPGTAVVGIVSGPMKQAGRGSFPAHEVANVRFLGALHEFYSDLRDRV